MATVNRELVCLKHMFNLAIKWGKAAHNPVKGVTLFREENHAERILTVGESRALVDACNGHVRDIVQIALNTGMRAGEILNLKWDQVDLRQGYIKVTRTKSGKERNIPMNGVVRQVLQNRTKDGIFVFHERGKPFGSVRTGFLNALRRSGIGHCRFHDLRHTFATRLVLSGISLPVVQELLGHASIVTTMRYAHPTPESKRKAVEVLVWRNADIDGHYVDTKGNNLQIIEHKGIS